MQCDINILRGHVNIAFLLSVTLWLDKYAKENHNTSSDLDAVKIKMYILCKMVPVTSYNWSLYRGNKRRIPR